MAGKATEVTLCRSKFRISLLRGDFQCFFTPYFLIRDFPVDADVQPVWCKVPGLSNNHTLHKGPFSSSEEVSLVLRACGLFFVREDYFPWNVIFCD